jgi:uncharacterized RmlC-like cupin family protein
MRVVDKGWGCEKIWADEPTYCGKELVFNAGGKCSMHFHSKKDETWFVRSGRFMVRWIDTETAKVSTKELTAGDVWHNPPLMPHQLICREAGTVSEVSTYDDPKDNHRVMPGDGQI